MNREIKFRGKRIDNGEWVYGSLVKRALNQFLIDYFDNSFNQTKIDPKTLGQYITITRGIKLYENDIIKLEMRKDDGYGDTYYETYYIKWDNYKMKYILHDGKEYVLGDLRGKYRPELSHLNSSYEIEVIGNIHDNADLLEGDE